MCEVNKQADQSAVTCTPNVPMKSAAFLSYPIDLFALVFFVAPAIHG